MHSMKKLACTVWSTWSWSEHCLISNKPFLVLITPLIHETALTSEDRKEKGGGTKRNSLSSWPLHHPGDHDRKMGWVNTGEHCAEWWLKAWALESHPPGFATQLTSCKSLGESLNLFESQFFSSSVNWKRENIPSRIVNIKATLCV